MVAEANRGVVFTIKARTDASVGEQFGKVSELAAAAQARLDSLKFAPSFADFKTGLDKVVAAHQEMQNKIDGIAAASEARRASARAAKKVVGFAAGLGPNDFGDVDQEQVRKAKEHIEHLQRLADLQQQKDDERAKLAADKQEARDKKTADRQAERDKKSAEQAVRQKQNELDELIRLETEFHADLADKKQKAQSEATRAAEIAQRKIQEALVGIKSNLTGALSSATDFARGLAYLGLVGEDDLGRLRDSLLLIEGGFRGLKGGIDVFRQLDEAARLYGERLKTIAEVERVAALASGGGGMADAAGGAAAGALGAKATGAGAAGLTITASGATTIGAAIAVAVGAALAARAGYLHATGQRDEAGEAVANATGATGLLERFMLGMAHFNQSQGKPVTAKGQLEALAAEEARKRTGRMDFAREQALIFADRDAATMQLRGHAAQQRIDLEAKRSASDNMVSSFATPAEQHAAALKQLQADRATNQFEQGRALADFLRTRPTLQGAAQSQENIAAEQTLLRIKEQGLALLRREQDLSEEKRRIDIDAAKEKLQLMGQQLAVAKQQVSAAQQAAEAARQKIEGARRGLGDLNAVEKAELLQAMRDLQAGKEISQKAAGLIDQHGDEAAKERLQAQRNKRDLAAEKELQGKGYDFGSSERKATTEAQQEAATAEHAARRVEHNRERERQRQEQKNEGAKFKIDLDNNVQIEIVGESKADAARRQKIQKAVGALIDRQQKQFDADMEEALAEVARQFEAKLQRLRQAQNAK